MAMSPAYIHDIRVPTEANLIKSWRDAALGTCVPGIRRRKAPLKTCACDGICACHLQKAVEFCLKGYDSARTAVIVLHEDFPDEVHFLKLVLNGVCIHACVCISHLHTYI